MSTSYRPHRRTFSLIICACFLVLPPTANSFQSFTNNNPSWLGIRRSAGGRNNGIHNNNNNNNNNKPPKYPRGNSLNSGSEDDNDDDQLPKFFLPSTLCVSSSLLASTKSLDVQGIIKGTETLFDKAISYWSNLISSLSGTKSNNTNTTDNNDLMSNLTQMDISSISVSTHDTVLPPEVVDIASRRAGLVVGEPLKPSSVSEVAKILKEWYVRHGYVLCSVTGANIQPSADDTKQPQTATVTIQTNEPRNDLTNPVSMAFAKEMVIDPRNSTNLLTFKQYKNRLEREKRIGRDTIRKSDLNTTYMQTTGTTQSCAIAKALRLEPGAVFQMEDPSCAILKQSGLFQELLTVEPVRLAKDGETNEPDAVQLRIIAIENPSRNLEYGVSKGMYSGGWEGELDFQHANVLGGNEKFGISLRRGTKGEKSASSDGHASERSENAGTSWMSRTVLPSGKITWEDGNWGRRGGYSLEAFNDYIGEDDNDKAEGENDVDPLLLRRGMAYSFQQPLPHHPKWAASSSASTSLERTTTRNGKLENMASVTLSVGPNVYQLPMNARHSILTSVTSGTKLRATPAEVIDNVLNHLDPYGSSSIISRQIFPLTNQKRPVTLAFRHALTASTNLPRHKSRAMGYAASVRGYTYSDVGSGYQNSLVGTAEVRFPIEKPTGVKVLRSIWGGNDATVVVFGDWLWASTPPQQQVDLRGGAASADLIKKRSVGLGLRKKVSGIPLKYDVTYTKDGKWKTSVGIGHDFDVY